MQIIGFNLNKIHAEKKAALKDNLQINSNISIKSVALENFDLLKDQSTVRITFEFRVDYSPDFAEIVFEGSIVLLLEEDKKKELLSKWKNKKSRLE